MGRAWFCTAGAWKWICHLDIQTVLVLLLPGLQRQRQDGDRGDSYLSASGSAPGEKNERAN